MKNYFKDHETTCKCGCGENNISNKFMEKLNRTRAIAGIPFMPTSFCRCKKHNRAVGGKEDSEHISCKESNVECEAVDIQATNSRARYTVIQSAILCGFNRIGIGKDFIHLGNSSTKAQEVIWLY